MPVVLSRIDDRLIHGQVVIGWGGPLRFTRIALVSDEVAASDWEQDLYRMAVPGGMAIEFASAAEATARLPVWLSAPEPLLILTGDVETMASLVDASEGRIPEVNLGGIHHRPGRTERLRYVYLDEAETRQLQRLEAAGVRVTAQDLPTATPVPLGELLA